MQPKYSRNIQRILFAKRPSFWTSPIQWVLHFFNK